MLYVKQITNKLDCLSSKWEGGVECETHEGWEQSNESEDEPFDQDKPAAVIDLLEQLSYQDDWVAQCLQFVSFSIFGSFGCVLLMLSYGVITSLFCSIYLSISSFLLHIVRITTPLEREKDKDTWLMDFFLQAN